MTDTEKLLSLDAPAKINLYLRVAGRRSDGYHLINSLVAFTGTCDRVTAVLDDSLTLKIVGPFSENLNRGEDENLILRAAHALRDLFNVREGAAVTLNKNLPVSAGVGGGSADAAATLRVLNKLWQIKVNDSELSRIGLSIGSDVPVCISGVPSQMSGIGETVVPVAPLPDCGVVLINSGESVPTPSVFAAHHGGGSNCTGWEAPSNFDEFVSRLKEQANDLAPAARIVSPEIRYLLGELHASDGCELERMSGSGGTCFGLFANLSAAQVVAERIRHANPNWWTVATTFRDARPEIRSLPG